MVVKFKFRCRSECWNDLLSSFGKVMAILTPQPRISSALTSCENIGWACSEPPTYTTNPGLLARRRNNRWSISPKSLRIDHLDTVKLLVAMYTSRKSLMLEDSRVGETFSCSRFISGW